MARNNLNAEFTSFGEDDLIVRRRIRSYIAKDASESQTMAAGFCICIVHAILLLCLFSTAATEPDLQDLSQLSFDSPADQLYPSSANESPPAAATWRASLNWGPISPPSSTSMQSSTRPSTSLQGHAQQSSIQLLASHPSSSLSLWPWHSPLRRPC
jgi:hypothetical protein